MANRFRLPCPSCSATNEVDPRQAGGTISCFQCGKPVEIPTLRVLRQLQTVEPSAPGKSKKSGTGQFVVSRLTFVVGLLIVLIGLGVGIACWIAAGQLETEPPAAAADRLKQAMSAIDRESPTQFWATWNDQVLAHPPAEFQESRWAENRRIARRQKTLGTIFLGLVPLGIATLLASAFIRK
jgi:hypothetical protein